MKMKRNREAGQSLVLVALALVFLIGFLGFAIDFGYYRYLRRQLQTAADAAALAGAMDFTYGDSLTAAQAASAENGFTNGVNGITVAANCWTGCTAQISTGPFIGSSYKNYVQAVVTDRQVPTFFSKMFGATAPTLSATAVAEGGLNCIYGLDQSSGALNLVASVVSSACGVVDNHNLSLTFAALCAPSIQLLGSQTGVFGLTCSGTGFNQAKPVKISAPVADPFCQSGSSCLPAPSPSPLTACSGSAYTVPAVTTLTPTTPALSGHCGITITGLGTAATPMQFAPGATGKFFGPIKITNSYVVFTNTGGVPYTINNSSVTGVAGITMNSAAFGNSTVLFQANTYTVAGGISDTGFGSLVNFNSSAGSNPSLIILDGGGLKLAGTAGRSTGGVTFYNTGTAAGSCVTCYGQISSTFNFSGAFCGAGCNMSAPTTGTYAGILFFQDRNDTSTSSCAFGGSASACFAASVGVSGPISHTGAYYFPTGTVSFNFNFGLGATYTYLIAKDVNWLVNFQFNTNYAALPTSFPLRQGAAVLVQ